jgi:hypothetical protein
MAPLTPHWSQPSHPSIQQVIIPSDPSDFTTKSISKVTLPPYALFAKFSFPPCTKASKPTYATVQVGRDEHVDLNSDLVYINHSCEPSVVSTHYILHSSLTLSHSKSFPLIAPNKHKLIWAKM